MATINGMSDYLENKLIDHFFRNTRYTPPLHVYLALFATVIPPKVPLIWEIDEVSYAHGYATPSGYTRVQCPPFGIIGSSASASQEIRFPMAEEDWSATATWFGLMDSPNFRSGNFLFYGDLTTPLDIYKEESVIISASSLTISLTGGKDGGWGEGTASNILDGILNENTILEFSGTNIYLALGRSLTTNVSYNFLNWLEITGADYSRKPIGNIWANPVSGSTINTSKIVYTVNAEGNWGNITNIVVFNSSSAGNPLLWGTLKPAINVVVGDGLEFSSGSIGIDLEIEGITEGRFP